jgi:hypothetical protein
MSQLVTIFEKIKDDFFLNHVEKGMEENYSLIFSPFSTGFTNDDFLFLDKNNASKDAHKYLDELFEFSQIANTIPVHKNYWAVSDNRNNILYNPYKSIIDHLKYLDIDSLNVDMLYGEEIFLKALNVIKSEEKSSYLSFYKLQKRLSEEIKTLQHSLTDSNKAIVELEIIMKNDNLNELKGKWINEGFKEKVEEKILEIVKDEFNRFIQKHIDIKGHLDMPRTHNMEFFPTFCTPNNLYKSDKLDWKKIKINEKEVAELLQKDNVKDYEEIFGVSELSAMDFESISFELIFVNVTRAWYDESILKSPFWTINILNTEEIKIPKVTSKLIFIRKIDIKLKPNSQNNEALLKNNIVKNIGPFMVNLANIKLGGNLQLNSVNKALKIDRKVVMNVGSKISKKQTNKPLNSVILNKQNQFIKLAPAINAKSASRKIGFRNHKTLILKKPLILSKNLGKSNIKYTFKFTSKNTNKLLFVNPNEIKIFDNNRAVNVNIQNTNKNLSMLLLPLKNYKLELEKEGYRKIEFSFKTTLKSSVFQIKLEPNPLSKSNEDSFQLIGVIAKKIEPFPTSLKKANYI